MRSYIGPEYQPYKVQNQTPFSILDHKILRKSGQGTLCFPSPALTPHPGRSALTLQFLSLALTLF